MLFQLVQVKDLFQVHLHTADLGLKLIHGVCQSFSFTFQVLLCIFNGLLLFAEPKQWVIDRRRYLLLLHTVLDLSVKLQELVFCGRSRLHKLGF